MVVRATVFDLGIPIPLVCDGVLPSDEIDASEDLKVIHKFHPRAAR
jgi:hypothetical protein